MERAGRGKRRVFLNISFDFSMLVKSSLVWSRPPRQAHGHHTALEPTEANPRAAPSRLRSFHHFRLRETRFAQSCYLRGRALDSSSAELTDLHTNREAVLDRVMCHNEHGVNELNPLRDTANSWMTRSQRRSRRTAWPTLQRCARFLEANGARISIPDDRQL